MQRETASQKASDESNFWSRRRLTNVLALVAISAGIVACDSAIRSVANSKTGAPSAAQIQVTPNVASVPPGGKIQFAATLLNSSNAAVLWTATAGTITPTGLFTAPAVSQTESVTITARSASSNLESSVSVGIMVPRSPLNITTTNLPPGEVGVSYSTAVAGTGGMPPYQWRVLSGTLPSGLQLNAFSGVISGITGESGAFPITLEVSDVHLGAAVQTFTLSMAGRVNTGCGPPRYPCSRSDLRVIRATAPPQLGSNPHYYGGHAGAGKVAIDPAYSNRILRVTDGNLDASWAGVSYSTSSSAEKNITSYDERLFFLHNEGDQLCLFDFEPNRFSTRFHGCFTNLPKSFDFGYTAADQRAFYGYHYAKLYRFVIDAANWTIAADPNFNHGIGYFDPDSPDCLNGQMAANHWAVGDSALSSDDNTYIASIGAGQDKSAYFVVWNASKGCQWMNVKTWQVSNGWNTGMKNPVNVAFASGNRPTPGGIHNAQLDRSGAYGVLAVNNVPSFGGHKLFWKIGTNQVDDTCVRCTSHWACDFGICFWDMGPGSGFGLASQEIGSHEPTPNMNLSAALGQWGDDEHLSHANATEGEKLIYLAAWQPSLGASSVDSVWGDEIVGVNWDGSRRTIRFNKNWASGYGGFGGSARCPISRQGNYALCGTDYQMYNLDKGFGNGLNQDTCDHNLTAGQRGTNGCRTDVLLFELR